MGGGVPAHVEAQFRAYLRCGVLAHGFARARCSGCGEDFLVAFSCKGRGICPSCNARRMAATAAHLTDHVIPRVPVRQWVLSVPKRLRWHLHRDPEAASAVLRILVRALRRTVRERSPGAGPGAQFGAVTFLHRFGSSLNPHFHYHLCVLDGIFEGVEGEGTDGRDRGARASAFTRPPSSDARMSRRSRRRSAAGCSATTLRARCPRTPPTARGPRRGRDARLGTWGRVLARRLRPHRRPRPGRPRAADPRAPTRSVGRARPPFALERLEWWGSEHDPSGEGVVFYHLARPAHDGRTVVRLTPLELLDWLGTLLPPPRVHRHRYHGVLAPNAALRSLVTPTVPITRSSGPSRRRGPVRWARLLARIYHARPLVCPGHRAKRGRGRTMRLIARPASGGCPTDPSSIREVLAHLEVPTRLPRVHPPCGPPEPTVSV